MLRSLSKFSVIVTFIAISLLGLALAPLLPVKLAPSESLPSIMVQFGMSGASARVAESQATCRVESALARVGGVKSLKSRSWNGGGRVTAEFDPSVDIEKARFEVAMIVRQLWSSLPENVSYPTISVSSVNERSSRPCMVYTINSSANAADIRNYAEKNIAPALTRLPGVAAVELSGATPFEWQIVYDSRMLASLGLSVAQLSSAVGDYFASEFVGIAGVGHGDSDNMRIVVTTADNTSAPDLSRIVLTTDAGKIITLDKVATAKRVEAAPDGYFRINGLNSLYLNITAADDANQIKLSEAVRNNVAAMSLPQGYEMNLNYDASERISEELGKIYFRTALTLLILLVFVGLITLSWRYLLLIAISLAINLAVAFVAYYMLGLEIQLYSLAGITISFNLVIDNLIVMTEHITRRRNLKAFTAVLAATLTTVGALSVVFFLDEKTLLSLKDFVAVVIVNLAVSLAVALFLVPALVEGLKVRKPTGRRKKPSRAAMMFSSVYARTIRFLCGHKALTLTVFVLAFGLPVFLLPQEIEGDGMPAKVYNATLGSSFYRSKMKRWVDICLGGTLRLFAENVREGYYWNSAHNEQVLTIIATLPIGSTLPQMDALIRKMEKFLVTCDGVRQFQTSVSGPRRASINVFFKPEHQTDGYPYMLKSDVVARALTLGGGSWSVFGLEDDMGFNNGTHSNLGNYRVNLYGYNYDELMAHASELADTISKNRRIREITINAEYSFAKDDYTEFYLDFDSHRLALDSLSVSDIYSALNREMGRNMTVGVIVSDDGAEQIRLTSGNSRRDVWSFMNTPLRVNRKNIKLSDYSGIEQRQTPQNIVKLNQEYTLCLQYDYLGTPKVVKKYIEETLERFNRTLPVGYRAEVDSDMWSQGGTVGYALLGLIAVIIFFVSSILFNSLRQPLAIILVIPVSFIGVFLTFYFFDLRFDQGVFAAFILLSGITVNAAIYIINEYNNLRRLRPRASCLNLYLKAFSCKISAVLLTVLSTVLGFIPFIVGTSRESFWFPLAAGTMGGLVLSLLAIFFLLPALILPKTCGK